MMARIDSHPPKGPGSSYPSISGKTSAAERVTSPYASAADPHLPAAMTRPLYDQPEAINDGHLYPTIPEFYDVSNAGQVAGGGGDDGQPTQDLCAMYPAKSGYPHGWNLEPVNLELTFPLSQDIVQGEDGHGIQSQATWTCGPQGHPTMMGGTMAMISPKSQYIPTEEPMGGCYELLNWPTPPRPMEQMLPSPGQSSYYASSPASGAGQHFSRPNSCSSAPAARAAALNQTPFETRFQPMPAQVVSPRAGQLTPGRTKASNNRLYPGTEFSPFSAVPTTAATTADYNAGILSPAFTPSPEDSADAVPNQFVSQSARCDPDQQAAHQKQGPAAQGQAQSPPKSRSRSRAQQHIKPRTPPAIPAAHQHQKKQNKSSAPSPQRARNREAATKFRAKSKLAVADLESTERVMSTANRELSATARGLRDEVLRLKNVLLAHGNCDDSLIQQYLTNQARIVGGSGGAARSS